MALRIVDKIAALPPQNAYFSYEFFPPKTDVGMENLKIRVSRLARLDPLFVTVTWGAGGSTCSKSLYMANLFQNQLGLTTCLHLTCTNINIKLLDEGLKCAKSYGIRNILALRGDPPRDNEYDWTTTTRENNRDFVHAVDLVGYIRDKYADWFCIGVAAYPEGHADGSNPEFQDPQRDVKYLIDKVKAGADFILCQMCFDADTIINFVSMLRNHPSGVFKSIPIIPGLLPLNTYQSFLRAAKLANASIPPPLNERLKQIPLGDDAQVKQLGVDLLVNIIDTVYSKSNHSIRGFHFYTLNLEKSVALILEKAAIFKLPARQDLQQQQTTTTTTGSRRRSSNLNNTLVEDIVQDLKSIELLATSTDGVLGDDAGVSLAISAGEGTKGREATWDDFPNGRWGDYRSPAFGGDADGGYGTSHLIQSSPKEARELWNYPKSINDIQNIFLSHLNGKIKKIPWSESDDGFNPETMIIKDKLLRLNSEKNYWTIASQPAVNAASSSDEIFGWGPKNGFVFQKPFVEFFVEPNEFNDNLLPKLLNVSSDNISFYAAGKQGKIISNMIENQSTAVTWGVFPNREIIQPTIIEMISFNSWRTEAFSIWNEWSKFYKFNSPSYNLLSNISNNYYLVSVLSHDFMDNDALWNFLLDDD